MDWFAELLSEVHRDGAEKVNQEGVYSEPYGPHVSLSQPLKSGHSSHRSLTCTHKGGGWKWGWGYMGDGTYHLKDQEPIAMPLENYPVPSQDV